MKIKLLGLTKTDEIKIKFGKMKSVGPSNRLKNDVREDLHMFVVTG
jgi:hypothetical protein